MTSTHHQTRGLCLISNKKGEAQEKELYSQSDREPGGVKEVLCKDEDLDFCSVSSLVTGRER